MPRLIQHSAARNAAAGPAPVMPPYEPLEYPLDDKGKNALKSMTDPRDNNDASKRKYEEHLKLAANKLGNAVGSINDILYRRQQQLAKMAERRRAQGVEEKSQEELETEEYIAELTAEISELTGKSEEALRKVLDCRAESQDTQKVMRKVLEEVQKQQPRPEPKPKKEKRDARRPAGGDEDGDDATEANQDVEMEDVEDVPPLAGVKEILKAARKANFDEYRVMSPFQRYAKDNDYIAFKRLWHDALHPDGDCPLPDASTWFDELGNAVMTVARNADEDDDLVVEREIMDLKCPLSLQVFREPFSNHRCKHTFEKSAIVEFINGNHGVAKCPVCSQELRISDFYLDEVVLRKVKRAEHASRQDVDATSDIEDNDSNDDSVVIGRTKNIKKERNPSRLGTDETLKD